MLHDTDRNDVYDKAISILVDNFQKIEGRAPLVLDVGAGTGLLSMMAARAGAAGVVGCEMFDTMASVATEVVEKNGLQEVVQIIPAKSSEIGLSTDLLVSELLDSSLLGTRIMQGLCFMFGGYISVLLLPYSLSSGALESPDLLQSCSAITLPMHITTILMITHQSISTPESTQGNLAPSPTLMPLSASSHPHT